MAEASESASPPAPAIAAGPELKAALLVIDIGSPESVADVKPFLSRLYSDPLVLDLPVGVEFQKTWAAVLAWRRGGKVREALKAAGGASPERALLLNLARGLCERLNAQPEGPRFSPYVALRHAAPTIDTAIKQIHADGCTRVVGLFVRPFPSGPASRSAVVEVRERSDDLASLDVSVIDRFFEDARIQAVYGKLLAGAIEVLPQSARADAHVLFVLDAQPISGKLDPRLEQARAFAEAVKQSAGLANPSSLAYQGGTDPTAPLSPTLEEELAKIAAQKRPAVVAMPIGHLCDTLASVWELDQVVRDKAKAAGIAGFVRVPCPNDRPELLEALETLVRRHLGDMQTIREQKEFRMR